MQFFSILSLRVQLIIEHPNYMAHEDKIKRMDFSEAFFRTEEKSQARSC